MLVRFAFDELDAVVDQVRVEVFDLILRELDILEPGGDLVVVEKPFLETVLNELVELFDVGQRDVDGEQLGYLPACRLMGTRSTYEDANGRRTAPRLTLSPGGVYTAARVRKMRFPGRLCCLGNDLPDALAVTVIDREHGELGHVEVELREE